MPKRVNRRSLAKIRKKIIRSLFFLWKIDFFSLTIGTSCGYHSIRMDNLTQENQDEKSQNSGEIFNDSPESAYRDAVAPEETVQDNREEEKPLTQPEAQSVDIDQSQYVPSSDSSPPSSPPPFEEDKRKKYAIFGIGIILILLLLIIVFFILKRKPKVAENITLNYWGLWEEEEIIRPIIDDYKKAHQNITINYTKQDPKQYRERLQAAIDRGEGPDIFRFHNTWVRIFTSYLSPLPKTIYSDEEYKKTFYPVAANDLKVGDNYYGIPLMIDGLLLFYNEDILKSANVAIPSTWVDVQNAMSKLTVKEKGRIVTSAIPLGTAENVEHFADILALMMLQNGTQMTKSLFSCSDPSSTSCAVEALTFYRKFAEAPNNTWDDTLENSIVAFANGRAAMVIAPSWQAFVIKEMAKNTNLNFKTAPVPQLPCEKSPCPSVNWATYWIEGVSSKSKYQAASWEFLKYLSSASTMQKLYAEEVKYRKLFGEAYSRVDLGKTLADNPYLASLISEVSTMQSFYSASRTYDGDAGLNTRLIKYLKDAVNSLSSGTSIETALKTVDNGFKQVFTDWKIPSATQ